MRNSAPLGPYRRPMPRALWWPKAEVEEDIVDDDEEVQHIPNLKI